MSESQRQAIDAIAQKLQGIPLGGELLVNDEEWETLRKHYGSRYIPDWVMKMYYNPDRARLMGRDVVRKGHE